MAAKTRFGNWDGDKCKRIKNYLDSNVYLPCKHPRMQGKHTETCKR